MKDLTVDELSEAQELGKVSSFHLQVIDILLAAINDWPGTINTMKQMLDIS